MGNLEDRALANAGLQLKARSICLKMRSSSSSRNLEFNELLMCQTPFPQPHMCLITTLARQSQESWGMGVRMAQWCRAWAMGLLALLWHLSTSRGPRGSPAPVIFTLCLQEAGWAGGSSGAPLKGWCEVWHHKCPEHPGCRYNHVPHCLSRWAFPWG